MPEGVPPAAYDVRAGDEHLTEFIFFLLRDHVPACVIEHAMVSAYSRRDFLDGYPELKSFAESVADHLLGRTEVH